MRRGGAARRLQLKPGKPIVLGQLRDRPILGLPGNPVAAMVNFLLFGRPLLRAMVGASPDRPVGQGAVTAEPFPHTRGRREFLPARIVGQDSTGACGSPNWVGEALPACGPWRPPTVLPRSPPTAAISHAMKPSAFIRLRPCSRPNSKPRGSCCFPGRCPA